MTSQLVESPRIKIGDEWREVRRLSVKDVFSVARILGVTFARGGRQYADMLSGGNLSPENFGIVFLAALPHAEVEIMHLLGSLIGMDEVEFGNQPADVVLELIDVVARSQDLSAFLDKARKLAEVGKDWGSKKMANERTA